MLWGKDSACYGGRIVRYRGKTIAPFPRYDIVKETDITDACEGAEMRTEIIIVGIFIIAYVISQLIKKSKNDRERKYITDMNNPDLTGIEYHIKTKAKEGYGFYYDENKILVEECKKIKDYINTQYTKGVEVKDIYLKSEELYILMSVYDYLDNKLINSYDFNKEYIKETQTIKGVEKTQMRKRDGFMANGAEQFKIIEKECPYTEYRKVLNERGIVIFKMLYSAYGFLFESGTVIRNEAKKNYYKTVIDNGYISEKDNKYRNQIID